MQDIVSIYIDGFNFYHSAIKEKGSEYYYPSLRRFSEKMLDEAYAHQGGSKAYKICEIHYFTAEVESTRHDSDKLERQQKYNDALEKEDGVIVHLGKFQYEEPDTINKAGNIGTTRIRKEKYTDVHLAVRMLNDAWKNRYNHGVLLSNDSDFTKLLELLIERNKKVSVWHTEEHPTKDLAQNAHSTLQIQPQYIKGAGPIANKYFKGRDLAGRKINHP